MILILSLIFSYCSRIEVRKEWRDLNSWEKDTYIKAVQLLKITPSKRNSKVSVHDEFTYIHYTHTKNFHKSPQFLPFHRVFLKKYEDSLNTVYQNYLAANPSQTRFKDARINLPYWNFIRDSNNILASPIWKDFGGFGTAKSNYCVKDGPFSNFIVNYSTQGRRCLRRKYENGKMVRILREFTMPKMMNYVKTWGMRSKKYNEFRYTLEWSVHTMPHIIIGGAQENAVGDMGQLDFSPNDPLFYLIHPTVDKIWFENQKADPGNLYRYDGKRYDGRSWNGGFGREVNILDRVQPFMEYRVLDAMSTTNLCYVYSRPWLPALNTVPVPPFPVNTKIISPASSILVQPISVTVQNKLSNMNVPFGVPQQGTSQTDKVPQQNAQKFVTSQQSAPILQAQIDSNNQVPQQEMQVNNQVQQTSVIQPFSNDTVAKFSNDTALQAITKRSVSRRTCEDYMVQPEDATVFSKYDHKPVKHLTKIPHKFEDLEAVKEKRKNFGYMGARYWATLEGFLRYMDCIS
eukprot:NODE_366_length_10082_cov_0.124211.p1 type:complete len:516 gc:universal NODE_366_length_10082_cov_0.124211:3871-2324(-)